MQGRVAKIEIEVELGAPREVPTRELAEGSLQEIMAFLAGNRGWRPRSVRLEIDGHISGYDHVKDFRTASDGRVLAAPDA